MSWEDSEIINSIKEGEEDGLVYMYTRYRAEFIRWVSKRYQVDDDMANDAFQEAILALRFNVVHNRLKEMRSSLKTYLFSIGKNQLLNRLKKSNYEISVEDLSSYQGASALVISQKEALTERQELIRKEIAMMQDPCHSILRMFYYLGYSMEVIAARMSYRNEDVAKSQKLRCLKKLKAAVAIAR